MIKKIVGLTGALLIVAASPATAHVTVQPDEAPAGAFFRFVVRVPNERDDADTTKVEVDFPDNLVFVSFQPKEGWDYKVKMKTLDEPIEAFGAEITEVVDTVTWSGGSIAPHEFDEFGFSTRVPEEEGPIEFAAFQTYSNGDVVEWTGTPDSEEPATVVNVVDLGVEEGQGQLAVLADVRERVEGMEHVAAPGDAAEDDDNLGLILGAVGTGLALLALIVALTRKKT